MSTIVHNLLAKDDFLSLIEEIEFFGYGDEIGWQRNVKECDTHITFRDEAIWVILNSGMKEQIARGIWEKIKQAEAAEIDIAEVFGHKGKVAAIKHIRENCKKLFEQYVLSDDKIEFLKSLPYIGSITCYHLAKNLGHDCVKPDRHLVRISDQYGMTPDKLCQQIGEMIGEKKCVIDIIIWRACNLKLI